jgi:hypothetical protein
MTLDPVVATGCILYTTMERREQTMMAAAGLLGALAAPSCCIGPLTLWPWRNDDARMDVSALTAATTNAGYASAPRLE